VISRLVYSIKVAEGQGLVKYRLCRCEVMAFAIVKYCASHKVKLSVPPTPAGTSLAKQTSRTEGVLIVPQGTLS